MAMEPELVLLWNCRRHTLRRAQPQRGDKAPEEQAKWICEHVKMLNLIKILYYLQVINNTFKHVGIMAFCVVSFVASTKNW